jgi:hypothetical protein
LPSGRYQASYWHEDKRRNAPYTFKTNADAQAWLSVTEADILRGAWIDPKLGKVTFKHYAEQWRAGQVHRRGTALQVETNLRRHVYPRLGDQRITSIRPSDVQGLVKAMAIGGNDQRALAPATVEVVYGWVSTIFKAAVRDRVITASPCEGIRRPEVIRRRSSRCRLRRLTS